LGLDEVALDHRNAEIMPELEVSEQDEAERRLRSVYFIDISNQLTDNGH
jgi:hypothetical protein